MDIIRVRDAIKQRKINFDHKKKIDPIVYVVLSSFKIFFNMRIGFIHNSNY